MRDALVLEGRKGSSDARFPRLIVPEWTIHHLFVGTAMHLWFFPEVFAGILLALANTLMGRHNFLLRRTGKRFRPKPPVSFIGKSTLDISANDLIWDFFGKHPMK